MNTSKLRKNYGNLTMLQRLALADNALGRDDDSEALAIKDASPKVTYTRPDFFDLYDEILRIRICNLVTRLGHIITFDYWLQMEGDAYCEKSSSRPKKRLNGNLRLAGYLYVRATDSWNAVNAELGLRPNFDKELGKHLFEFSLLIRKDSLIREVAFSEVEAMAFVRKATGETEFRTIADEIDGYRKMLELDRLH